MARISSGCEGLFLVSETEAPVEPVALPQMNDLSVPALLRSLGREDERCVAMGDAAEFFARLTRRREWHSEAEAALAGRFANLNDILEEELQDMNLYRLGEVRVDIFVLGRTRGGTVAGVRTRAVET